MSALRAQFGPLQEQFRANPRLRLGVVVIALILIWQGGQSLSDAAHAAAHDQAEEAARLQRTQEIAEESEWHARAMAARTLLAQLQAEIPDAATPGLAQANLQTQLAAWMSGTPRMRLQIGAATTVPGIPDLWAVSASVSGPADPSEVMELVRKAESQRQLIVVEDLRLTTGRARSGNLRLVAYYRVPSGTGLP